MKEFADAEEFILTVTANGYGKRTSAYEYRRTNRGGQGITNIETSERNGCVVASFPAHNGEQLMLVTDQAKLIRTTVGDIRIAGRNTQGVTIFRVADNEQVVSAARIDEDEEPENEAEELVVDEVANSVSEPEGVQLDDGTGPHTLDERVDEDGD
jgi:DNA gyrase subunit A